MKILLTIVSSVFYLYVMYIVIHAAFAWMNKNEDKVDKIDAKVMKCVPKKLRNYIEKNL